MEFGRASGGPDPGGVHVSGSGGVEELTGVDYFLSDIFTAEKQLESALGAYP